MERMTPDTTDFNSLSKKQLVELVIAKYNDCFRLEEENKKLKAELQDKQKVIQYYRKEKGKLKEENKKLKERINTMQEFIDYSE
jgi:FtsZ-binding cell division protein ZapB